MIHSFISLIKGRFLGGVLYGGASAAPARGFATRSRAASGIIHAGTTAGAGDAVPGLGQERVTPAWTASQEAWPGAEPRGQSLGESRSGAPEGERAFANGPLPRPAHIQAVTFGCVARTLVGCASRRSAPSLCEPGANLKESCCRRRRQTSDAERVARTVFYFVIAGLDPAIHADAKLVQILRVVSLLSLQHGPPGQARW